MSLEASVAGLHCELRGKYQTGLEAPNLEARFSSGLNEAKI